MFGIHVRKIMKKKKEILTDLVAGVGAAVDSEMLFHECPHCNSRCNCSAQPCCCCKEDFYDDIRDGSLQQLKDVRDKEQP